MRIKSISLQNFLSFKKTKLELLDNALDKPNIYIISGINYDNIDENTDESSNGSGKSAFIGESVMYSIFGKGLRGTKQKLKLNEMIMHGCTQMANDVEYFIKEDDEDRVLKISRTKKDKTSTTNFEIDGETKSKRLKKLSDQDIKQYVDLESDTFSQIVVYYKDNLNLLSMNYSQRIEFFKKLIKLDLIDEYYEKTKSFKDYNNKILEQMLLNKKNTEEIIEIIDENKEKYEKFLKSKIKDIDIEIDELNEKTFDDIEQFEDELSELKLELKALTKELNELSNNNLTNKNDADRIEREIKKINALSGASCPTCKQEVNPKYVEKIVENYKLEYNTFNDNIKNNNIKIKSIEKDKTKVETKVEKVSDIIYNIQSEISSHNQKLKNLNNEKTKLVNEIKNISEENNSVDKNKYKIKLNCIIKGIETRSNWKEQSEYWLNMFAPKSLLRASIIRKYIVILSDIFEYYISKLYNNEIIGKITIDDDGNIDITLYKDGFETNYWQLSSGERKRVDASMMLSLYEFTSFINPHLPKFIILDEVLDSLDKKGIKSVMNTIYDIQTRHNIDVFLISHIPINMEELPTNIRLRNILVSKKNKTSSVEFIN